MGGLLDIFKPKKKNEALTKNQEHSIQELVHSELKEYMTRADVKGIISEINRDKARKAKFDGLSKRKKLQLLRYLADKKKDRRT